MFAVLMIRSLAYGCGAASSAANAPTAPAANPLNLGRLRVGCARDSFLVRGVPTGLRSGIEGRRGSPASGPPVRVFAAGFRDFSRRRRRGRRFIADAAQPFRTHVGSFARQGYGCRHGRAGSQGLDVGCDTASPQRQRATDPSPARVAAGQRVARRRRLRRHGRNAGASCRRAAARRASGLDNVAVLECRGPGRRVGARLRARRAARMVARVAPRGIAGDALARRRAAARALRRA